MKHRFISHTVYPPGYIAPTNPAQQTRAFNRWAIYIHSIFRKL